MFKTHYYSNPSNSEVVEYFVHISFKSHLFGWMKVRAATGSREGGVALSVDLLIRPYICLVIAIVTIAINIDAMPSSSMPCHHHCHLFNRHHHHTHCPYVRQISDCQLIDAPCHDKISLSSFTQSVLSLLNNSGKSKSEYRLNFSCLVSNRLVYMRDTSMSIKIHHPLTFLYFPLFWECDMEWTKNIVLKYF